MVATLLKRKSVVYQILCLFGLFFICILFPGGIQRGDFFLICILFPGGIQRGDTSPFPKRRRLPCFQSIANVVEIRALAQGYFVAADIYRLPRHCDGAVSTH
jgi:hypothetical protein